MGVQALPLGLLAVSKFPPPKACRIFTLVHASVIVSILTFVVSVSAPSLLFPMVAGQAFEGFLTCLDLKFRENRLLRLVKFSSCRAQMRPIPRSFLRFFRWRRRSVVLGMISIQIKPKCTISSERGCLRRDAASKCKPAVLPKSIRRRCLDRRGLPGGGGIIGQWSEVCSNTYVRRKVGVVN